MTRPILHIAHISPSAKKKLSPLEQAAKDLWETRVGPNMRKRAYEKVHGKGSWERDHGQQNQSA